MAIVLQGKGQSDQLPVQYFLTPSLVNPALSGKGDNIELRAGYRHRMTGIDDSPTTYFLMEKRPISHKAVSPIVCGENG